MFTVIAFVLISLFLVLVLKNHGSEYALLLSVLAGCLALVFITTEIYPHLEELKDRLSDFGVDSSLVKYLFKVFGICYITRFAAELCEDFGQTSLSGKIDFAGRATVLILSVPLLSSVLEIAATLI